MTAHTSAPVTATPRWLVTGEIGLCPCSSIGRRRKGSYLAKTIDGAAGVVRQALFADDLAKERGLLQRIEPRVKVVSLLALLVVTALQRTVPGLLAVYAVALALAALSRIPVGFFVKRVWLFIPIFTGIVVLPATLSVVTPGHVVLPLGSCFGHRVGVTSQGLRGAGLIVTRVATSVSLVVLLTLTTSWSRLLAALRALLVPRMFVMVLAMAYRYLFLLLGSVQEMYVARTARTVARGYRGEIRVLRVRRPGWTELVWVVTMTVVAVSVIGLDRALR